MERVSTGIYGLDELIEGGFPRGRVILISGACGTGKSIFGLQYLYKGVTDYNDPGVFVTLDERPERIREDMTRFGWNFKSLEDKGKLAIIDVSSAKVGFPSEEKFKIEKPGIDVDRLLLKIIQICDQIGAKRVVIDSLAGLGLHVGDESEVRKTILKINYILTKFNATTIITSEIPEQIGGGLMFFSKYGVEEYIADGVIVLRYLSIGTEANRTLFVRKMRGTKHCEDILPMEITTKGLVVKRPEEAFKV